MAAHDPASRSVLFSLGDQGGYVRHLFSDEWLLWAISNAGVRVLTGYCVLEGTRQQVGR
jgi:hypothetical protein